MSSPTITFAHVNSIYVRQHGDYNGYEFGWVWEKGKQPQWFAVFMEGGVYEEYRLPRDVVPGTNHYYSVVIDSLESPPKVRFRLDGELVLVRMPAYFPTGYSVWGSERQRTDETNFGHFWNLNKRRHDFSWVNWENHRQWYDNDPGYRWYWISNTEGKAIKG